MPPPDKAHELRIVISSDQTGVRLDRYLASLPEINSRSHAARLIEQNLVSKLGIPLKASHRLQTGEELLVLIPPPPTSELMPSDFPVDVVFENPDCAVINKPAGLVVHPAAGHAQDTLVNALLGRMQSLSQNAFRPGIVHRLDKDTSGLLVIAKNDRAHEQLAQQFKARSVHRIYWGLIIGRPKVLKGRIESHLRRHPTHRKKFASQPEGKRAITHYEVLNSNQGLSFVRLKLETGRTHQIRVHMAELGHPLVTDPIYGKSIASLGQPLQKQVKACLGIGLHASELGFHLPGSPETRKFFAGWPMDWQAVVQALGFEDVSKPIA